MLSISEKSLHFSARTQRLQLKVECHWAGKLRLDWAGTSITTFFAFFPILYIRVQAGQNVMPDHGSDEYKFFFMSFQV